jgi:muramoyltetrapeptide carboxypeptidase
LQVELGHHVFSETGYLAGTDEQRLADINDALRDEGVRAIFATTGGKGSYRIADKLDFAAAARNPKPLIGFSDITALHLALLRESRLAGVHGPLSSWSEEFIGPESVESLRSSLMTDADIVLRSDPVESTSALTTRGKAVGPLIGGNLDMLAICAGWALPSLDGAILLSRPPARGWARSIVNSRCWATPDTCEGLKGSPSVSSRVLSRTGIGPLSTCCAIT